MRLLAKQCRLELISLNIPGTAFEIPDSKTPESYEP